MRTPFEHIHLRVPPEQKELVDDEAAHRGVTVNQLVGTFIAEALGGSHAASPRGRRPHGTGRKT